MRETQLTIQEDLIDSEVNWIDQVPSRWKILHLKNCVCKKITDGPHETPIFYENGVPFLSVEAVKDGKLIFESMRGYISKETDIIYSKKCKPRRNDIFIVKSGATTGKIGYVETDENFNIWSPLALVRVNKNFYPLFMFYFLLSVGFQKQVQCSWSFGTQQNIGMSVLERLHVLAPDIHEQKMIAEYLDEKKAKIEQKVRLLEQKAYKYAELKQSLINETVMRGLDKTVPLKDSGVEWIGQVPEHWNIFRIKDYTYVKGRIGWQGLRNSDFLDQSEFYCVTGTDLINGSIDWSTCYYVSKERYDQDSFIQLKLGDLLITKDGSIGKAALVNRMPQMATLNSGIFVTRPLKSKYINDYMYWVVNSQLFKDYIDLKKGGSTIQHLYQNVFDRFIYPCPPLIEQKQIVDYLNKKTLVIDSIIHNINFQIEQYKELRKTLINDVVTGKIRVV